MLNILSNTSPLRAQLAIHPIRTLVKLDQKRRQRQSLKKLDANALSDIGMSIAQRKTELRNLRNW